MLRTILIRIHPELDQRAGRYRLPDAYRPDIPLAKTIRIYPHPEFAGGSQCAGTCLVWLAIRFTARHDQLAGAGHFPQVDVVAQSERLFPACYRDAIPHRLWLYFLSEYRFLAVLSEPTIGIIVSLGFLFISGRLLWWHASLNVKMFFTALAIRLGLFFLVP